MPVSESSIKGLIRRWNSIVERPNSRPVLAFQVHRTSVTPSLRCFLIEDRSDHLIPFTATHYLTDYGLVGKSPKTAENIAYALAYLFSFAKHGNLNLNDLIATGGAFNRNQVGDLISFIRSRGLAQRTLGRRTLLPMGKDQTNRIAGQILRYLCWGLETYNNTPGAEIERLMAKFRELRFSTIRTEDDRVLKPTLIGLVEDAFDLDSAMVWKNPLDRCRNNGIFGIANETGARISEIMALQVGDVGVGSVSVIHIVKRANDSRDPRRERPSAKTFGRTLPISKQLHTRIAAYIQQRPRKNHNIYLFLSHDGKTTGKPLSLRRAHALWDDVARAYAADLRLVFKPSWHDVRYTTLYRLYQLVKHKPNAKEILKQAAGHISDSVFLRYHRMAIMEDVQEHLTALNSPSSENLETSLPQESTLTSNGKSGS